MKMLKTYLHLWLEKKWFWGLSCQDNMLHTPEWDSTRPPHGTELRWGETVPLPIGGIDDPGISCFVLTVHLLCWTDGVWPAFVKPPHIVVNGLPRLFYFRPLPSELAERNSTKTGHILGRECGLKCVQNLRYTLPLTNPMFWAPWHQSTSTYSQPSFSSSTWKRGGYACAYCIDDVNTNIAMGVDTARSLALSAWHQALHCVSKKSPP